MKTSSRLVWGSFAVALFSVSTGVGCGSSSSSGGSGGASGSAGASTGGSGGSAGGGTGGTAGSGGSAGGGGCGASTPVALTIKNYLSWCSVDVPGGSASTAPSNTVCVASAATSLSATALTGFELGPKPWHDTDGDTGSGDPGTVSGTGQAAKSTAAETPTGNTDCVWVCCPFTGGTGCPTTDQCP